LRSANFEHSQREFLNTSRHGKRASSLVDGLSDGRDEEVHGDLLGAGGAEGVLINHKEKKISSTCRNTKTRKSVSVSPVGEKVHPPRYPKLMTSGGNIEGV
jgi:hypothetical protein